MYKSVIVTLTTIPGRVHLLWPVLNSLLHRQTQPPTAVIVNLPLKYNGDLGSIRQVPKEWQSLSKVQLIVNRNCNDDGPATKLIGAASIIAKFPKPPGHLHGRRSRAKHILRQSARASPPPVQAAGRLLRSRRGGHQHGPFARKIYNQWDPEAAVHVPSGVGSVSVLGDRISMADLVKRVQSVSATVRMADDMVFADWFARRRLPVFTLGRTHLLQMQPHAVDEWALHRSLRGDCDVVPDKRYATACAELGVRFGPLGAPPPAVKEEQPHAPVRHRRLKMWKAHK